jgi:cytochrome o ubiquinol oxidase subunit 1
VICAFLRFDLRLRRHLAHLVAAILGLIGAFAVFVWYAWQDEHEHIIPSRKSGQNARERRRIPHGAPHELSQST